MKISKYPSIQLRKGVEGGWVRVDNAQYWDGTVAEGGMCGVRVGNAQYGGGTVVEEGIFFLRGGELWGIVVGDCGKSSNFAGVIQ